MDFNMLIKKLKSMFIGKNEIITETDIDELIDSLGDDITEDMYTQIMNALDAKISGNIVNNLNSTDSTKSLSASQGKILNDTLSSTTQLTQSLVYDGAELLWEGGVQTGSITLTKNPKLYRGLWILINSSATGIPFGGGFWPGIAYTNPNTTTTVAICNAEPLASGDPNEISFYAGRLACDNQTVNIMTTIRNIVLIKGKTVGGSSKYYIRQIWGIK